MQLIFTFLFFLFFSIFLIFLRQLISLVEYVMFFLFWAHFKLLLLQKSLPKQENSKHIYQNNYIIFWSSALNLDNQTKIFYNKIIFLGSTNLIYLLFWKEKKICRICLNCTLVCLTITMEIARSTPHQTKKPLLKQGTRN